jgi:hypothetical protein
MRYYKIQNITDTLNKRDIKYNLNLSIKYVNNMNNIEYILEPGKILYLQIKTLPTKIYNLKFKGMAVIEELDYGKFKKLLKIQNKKVTEKIEVKEVKPILKKTKRPKIKNIVDNTDKKKDE